MPGYEESEREKIRSELPDDPSFDDYLTPAGEYGLPAYIYFPEVRRRFAQRRAQYIRREHDLSDTQALAIAASHADCRMSWIASEAGVTRDTITSNLKDATEEFGIELLIEDPPLDPEAPFPEDGTPASEHRLCPLCGKQRVVGAEEAPMAYMNTGQWDVPFEDDSVEVVCAFCHGFRYDGEWCRIKDVGARALELSSSGSKDMSHYTSMFDDAPTPGKMELNEEAIEDRRRSVEDDVEW